MSFKLVSIISRFQRVFPSVKRSLNYSYKPVNYLTNQNFCTSVEGLPKPKERYSSLNPDLFQALTNGNEDLVKKLKLVEFEYDVYIQEGAEVPASLSLDEWKNLLNLETRGARRKFLNYLQKLEYKRINRKIKKEEKSKLAEAMRKENPRPESDHITYGLNQNSIFLKIYETKVDQFNNSKCILASKFDHQLIIDLGFCDHMNRIEQANAAKQLVFAFRDNRNHDFPFPLMFCNIKPETELMKRLSQTMPSLYSPDFPVEVTTKSYLDLFPKEKLVYLTPHCKDEITHFDHDCYYIIGGIVDKSNDEPLTLAKAKKEGIKMARLPLEKYLAWGMGRKSLTLNGMVNILLEVKTSGDWTKALKQVIPRRHWDDASDYDGQKMKQFVPRRYSDDRLDNDSLNQETKQFVPRRNWNDRLDNDEKKPFNNKGLSKGSPRRSPNMRNLLFDKLDDVERKRKPGGSE